MSKFTVLNHPLIQHKLTIIRNKNTGTKVFREVANEIGELMVYEITRDLPLKDAVVETPMGLDSHDTARLLTETNDDKDLVGLGMVDGVLELIPAAKVGHIGMYRDEQTLKPHEYFVKLPSDIDQRELFIVDPMLATGGSANMAIDALKKRGAKHMRLVVLVAAPEGLNGTEVKDILNAGDAAKQEEKITDSGYIFPGLGDAGDRLFGTK
ncbi:uracil phosphoribosyltransferase [Companilactobacillus bobalius]|uniref:uracil phosphoribosyltransferase n=1 Tax=Companilactobacillus bobalius TaxID=2801451 RepID=UPI001302BFAE|nr:uracil phosphoribosyltransferase [Companilactobacillus bobalius]KAE9560167.1 uracil phosphoribosyltransferase [Companilactobacillus bobalius]